MQSVLQFVWNKFHVSCTARLLVSSSRTAACHFSSATRAPVPSQPVPQSHLPGFAWCYGASTQDGGCTCPRVQQLALFDAKDVPKTVPCSLQGYTFHPGLFVILLRWRKTQARGLRLWRKLSKSKASKKIRRPTRAVEDHA